MRWSAKLFHGKQSGEPEAAPKERVPVPAPPERNLGNRQGLRMQAKLRVGEPDDPLEGEADRMADRVLSMTQTGSTAAPAASGTPPVIRRKCAACEGEERVLAKEMPGPVPPLAHIPPAAAKEPALRTGGGRPLSGETRAFFEPRFGFDFSAVRVHADDAAADLSRGINALAFAYGTDLYFSRGRYDPDSREGKRLLAHELSHVVQQKDGLHPFIQRDLDGCRSLISYPALASRVSGTAVHAAILADFMGTTAGAVEVGIPGASASPLRSMGICGGDITSIAPQILGGRAGMGFPDLARIATGGILQVAEIKPAAYECLIDGELQLLGYVEQGNAPDPAQASWRAGLGVTGVVPMPSSAFTPPTFNIGSVQIRTAWCNDGLMAYSVSTRVPVPPPVRVESEERERERERLRARARERERELAVGGAVVVGTGVAALAGRALWRHFWSVVGRRFALRGAIAAGLAAADGPLPFGELIDLGIGLATVIEICVVWDDLWREADALAAQGA